MLAPTLTEIIISVLPALELVSLMLSSMMGIKYLKETYPESKKINKILAENNFFKPVTSDNAEHTLPAQEQSSVCEWVRGLVA